MTEDNQTTQASNRGWEEYPTTRFLQKSRQSLEDFDESDCSSTTLNDSCQDLDTLSEYSELLVATEQAQNPITSAKLL